MKFPVKTWRGSQNYRKDWVGRDFKGDFIIIPTLSPSPGCSKPIQSDLGHARDGPATLPWEWTGDRSKKSGFFRWESTFGRQSQKRSQLFWKIGAFLLCEALPTGGSIRQTFGYSGHGLEKGWSLRNGSKEY